MAVIWFHLITASVATGLGLLSLLQAKGTPLHRLMDWLWLGLMSCAALSFFLIRQVHPSGGWSWLHQHDLWSVVAIRQGNTGRHANFMKGAIVGAVAAGTAAVRPGAFSGRDPGILMGD